MKIQSILVPVDYSECSAAAVTLAAEVASKFGAELAVVHVWDRPAYVSDEIQVGRGAGARSLIELIRENAASEMAQFMAKLSVEPALKCSTRLLSGNPAATILKVLQDGKHQLLVMGTHGRTGLRHVLLGSVAEKLVRLSPVPVLTVPPDRESQP